MNRSRQPSPVDRRANQKARTRKALLDAAGELLRQGTSPTVADAAASARVSRATAYRYFPTQEHLQIELGQLAPAMRPVDELMGALPDDVAARLGGLSRTFNSAVIDQEVAIRTMLRAGLDTWLTNHRKGVDVPVREGRRMAWLDRVLKPVHTRLSKAHYRRLRAALALTLGPDSVVILKDVCGLDDAETLALLDWAAQALLKAGLAQAAPKPPGTRRAGRPE